MINAIRMDVYRMFHMKSFWVMTVIIIAMTFFTTTMTKADIKENDTQEESDYDMPAAGFLAEGEDPEEVSFGIRVESTGMKEDNVTVSRILFENFSSMFAALFMVIFAVLFSIADMKSGYIKNIGGQISSRSVLIVSKSVVLFLYTLYFIILFAVVQAISCRLIFGYTKWGNWKTLFSYLGVQLLLHFAILLICMTVGMVVRNNAFSMTFAVCLCLGVMNFIYMLMDRVINRYIDKDFTTYMHTVTGKIAQLPLDFTSKEAVSAIIVAIAFSIVMIVINIFNMEKRDLV